MKKLLGAALLLDFWLGQGVRAAAIPAAVLPMLCIALRPAFGRLSPFARLSRASNAGQSKKDTQPCGREQDRPSGRVARSVTACCGDAPACALPYGHSCSRAALSNFFTGSQTGTASFMNLVRICKAWSPCAAKSLPRQSVRSR